jgi:hypothetical protein
MPLPVAPTYAAAVAPSTGSGQATPPRQARGELRQPGISLRRTLAYAALIGVPFALVYGLGLYLIAKVL